MIFNFNRNELSASNYLIKNLYKKNIYGFDVLFYYGDFYMDGERFFPITTGYETSLDLFSCLTKKKYENYFSINKDFFNNVEFQHEDCFIVGSNKYNNYYHNLIDFYQRLLLANRFMDKKIILGTFNYENVISKIINTLNIKNEISYVDYSFRKYTKSIFVVNDFTRAANLYNKLFAKNDLELKKFTYISRKDSNHRHLSNEDEVIEMLKNYGFGIYELSKMDFDSQIKLFSSSSIILSLHGAGLTNLVFSQPGQKVIEIVPNMFLNDDDFFSPLEQTQFDNYQRLYFKNICRVNKLKHFFYFANTPDKNINTTNLMSNYTKLNLKINIERFKTFLENLIK